MVNNDLSNTFACNRKARHENAPPNSSKKLDYSGGDPATMAAPAAMPEFKGNVAAVPTAPYWDTALADIELKINKVRQMAWLLRTKNKNHANKDGKMTGQQQQAYLTEYRAKLITAEEEALWQRGASNGGYHYLGCAKTMAQIGKAFAEAMLEMEKK